MNGVLDCIESRQQCHERGMQLLQIKDQEKNKTVSKLNLNECDICFYQLGITWNNSINAWIWDDSDTLSAFDRWYYGFPADSARESYAVFYPSFDNYWVNVDCQFPAYFICEYNPTI